MPSGPAERYDFFLSRRGSVAAVAREVTDVLKENGYKVNVEDYDFRTRRELRRGHARRRSRTRATSSSFTPLITKRRPTPARSSLASWRRMAKRGGAAHHHPALRGRAAARTAADIPFQDLVGVAEPEERKRRIIAAAERQSQAAPPPPRPFIGVPPRIASFTGRADELDRLDAILMQDKPAAVTQAS